LVHSLEFSNNITAVSFLCAVKTMIKYWTKQANKGLPIFCDFSRRLFAPDELVNTTNRHETLISKMKLFFCSFAVASALCSPIFAKDTSTHSPTKFDCQKLVPQGWLASTTDLKSGYQITFFGEIHRARPSINSDDVEAKCWLNTFDLVIVEVAQDAPTSHTSKTSWNCVSIGAPKYWEQALVISANAIYSWSSLRPTATLTDLATSKWSASKQFRVTGLEKMSYQATMLDKLQCDVQRRLLQQASKDAQSGATLTDYLKVVRAYDNSDLEQVLSALHTAQRDDVCNCNDQVNAILIDERNKKFAARVLNETSNKKLKVLVLVGLAHLVGKESVIEHMQKMGVKVGPLRSSAATAVKPVTKR
jgi:hypothetical protein